jgi:hypothetical protein
MDDPIGTIEDLVVVGHHHDRGLGVISEAAE